MASAQMVIQPLEFVVVLGCGQMMPATSDVSQWTRGLLFFFLCPQKVSDSQDQRIIKTRDGAAVL